MPVRLPPGRARLVTSLQRIDHERNNRYCSCCGPERGHDGISPGDDHIRVAGHDLPDQIGITFVMALGGIAFDDQIFSFDVTQAAQLTEKRGPCAPPTRFGEKGRRDCRMENRYPPLHCRLLRARRNGPCRRTSEHCGELTSSHAASSAWRVPHGCRQCCVVHRGNMQRRSSAQGHQLP
jgi:hypothetical protein